MLPKPFTKEGLLHMLEKHLGHLKKIPDGMDALVPQTSSSMPQSSATQSLKDENSPTQSPSTISTWHSPGQFPGITPTHAAPPSHFMQPVPAQPPYGIDHNSLQYQPPQTPIGAPRQTQHRRQISELTGSDDITNDSKRQRMYTQQNPLPLNQIQRGRPV